MSCKKGTEQACSVPHPQAEQSPAVCPEIKSNSLKDWVNRQLSMKYTDLVLCRQQELSAASRSAHAAHAEMFIAGIAWRA